jgi:hypothetical protein
MARRGGGSNAVGTIVLVLFLVFFILLSISLGVTTYLGFAQDDSKDKDLKKQKDALAAMEKQRDWYRFQALLYRSYMGGPPAQNLNLETLGSARKNYDDNVLGAKEDDREEVKAVVQTLDTTFGWDTTQKRPKKTYEALLTEEKTKAETAATQSKTISNEKENEKAQVKDLQGQLAKAQQDYKNALDAVTNRAKADLMKVTQENDDLKAETMKITDRLVALEKSVDDDRRAKEKVLKEKDKEIAELRSLVAVKDQANQELRKELRGDVPAVAKTDWRVVRIDARGETAYINLGSADKVQPQLTFRVHGLGTDGRPLPKDKATVEVLDVLGDHLSQVKINYVTTPKERPRHDPRHDPVVTGDVLINPSWNPNLKKHVAIAGIVDLTGSGRDDTESFVRALERQNVAVDAYLDLRKDFTIKGPGITVNTDYLILGEEPVEVLGAQGRDAEIKQKISEAMKAIRKQAEANGVKVIGLRRYLDEIGYRIPGNPEAKKPVIDYKGDGSGLPPQVPKEPMKKDDKPMPPMPER